MNRLLVIVLLANLAFACLSSTPASLRKSAAHKKRLGDSPSVVALHRRLVLGLNVGDDVIVRRQSDNGDVLGLVNSVLNTLLADPAEASSSSGTPSSSPESSTPTPPPSGSSSGTSPTPGSVMSPSQSSPPPSGSSPSTSPTSSSVTSPSQSSPPPSGSSSGTSPTPGSVTSPSQSSTPPSGSSSDTPPTPGSVTSPSQLSPSGTEPPSSPAPPPSSTPTPALSSDTVGSQDCGLLGLGCILSPSQTPSSVDDPPSQASQPPSITDAPSSNPTLVTSSPFPTQPPSLSSNSVATQPQPSSAPDDHCPHGTLCSLSLNLPVSSSSAPTQPPPPGSSSVATQSQPSSAPGDNCLLSSIGCLSNSTPVANDPTSTWPLQVSTDLPSLATLSLTSETQPPSPRPLSTTGISTPSNGSTSVPSATPIIFPTSTSGLPLPSTPVSTSTPTPALVPTSGWLTETSLIFSSIGGPTPDGMSLTDPDQVPTSTSSPASGTPSVAPSVAPLPSGMPARIVPGGGGVDPASCHLYNLTLIALLFKPELNWNLVSHNSDSSGQLCLWSPMMIAWALGISNDQCKTSALQVQIPDSYQGPQDVFLLQTLWLGCIPTGSVGDLAAQIKTMTSQFYNASSPYSALAALVDPAFNILTVGATTDSGGPNSGSPGGATSGDSRTRKNTIIGVVCALGGITLIIIGYLIRRAVQKRRELVHRRLSDPPTNAFIGEAPPNRNFDQDSIGGQRRRSFYFAEDSLRGFSDHSYTNDGTSLSPEQTSGSNRRQIAGNIGPPIMRENSLNF